MICSFMSHCEVSRACVIMCVASACSCSRDFLSVATPYLWAGKAAAAAPPADTPPIPPLWGESSPHERVKNRIDALAVSIK